MDKQPSDGILEEFRREFLDCWQRLPNKELFLVLFGAWLALFHLVGNSTFGYIDTPSLLKWMYLTYKPKENAIYDDGQGNLIPFLVAGLFWWKRKELMALELKVWWPGLVLVVAGLVGHIIGYVTQQPRISIVGLFVGLYGLMGLAWGPSWLRASVFPFFLFAFCVPIGTFAEPVTFRLQLLVCQLVEWIAPLLAIDVLRHGTQLSDPTGQYQYEVAAACSGIRSLVAIFVLAIVYGFISFPAAWKRLVVMGSAFPLAVLGNLVRMMLIVIAAEIGGQSWGNYVHESSVFSMIPYIPAIGGLLLLGRFLGEGRRLPAKQQKSA